MQIVVANADDAPFTIDASVHEEDTWQTLSAPADVIRSPGHPVRVMTGAWSAEPMQPGAVVVQPGSPTRLLAIVHDLDAEPSWQSPWVAAALDAVFEEADRRDFSALRLPLLGSRHGELPAEAFAALLRERLERRAGGGAVRRIWLLREGGVTAAALLRAVTGSAPIAPRSRQ